MKEYVVSFDSPTTRQVSVIVRAGNEKAALKIGKPLLNAKKHGVYSVVQIKNKAN